MRYYETIPENLYSVPAVAREFKVMATRIRVAIELGLFPGPQHQHGARLYYDQSELKSLKPHVEKLATTLKPYNSRRALPKGWYAKKTIADLAGVGAITVEWHLAAGRFQRPTHRIPYVQYPVYNEEEKDQFLKILKERKGFQTAGKRGKRTLD